MSTNDDELAAEVRRRRAAVGGLARSAKLSPEERTAIARKAGLARQTKLRADREANGLPPIKPRVRPELPPMDVLEPYLEQIDAERGDRPITYEERMRDAVVRYRRDVAAQALAAVTKKRAAE